MKILSYSALLISTALVISCSFGTNLSDWDPSSENFTSLEMITTSEATEDHPSSLADSLILFSSDRQGNRDIWATPVSGGGTRQLTSSRHDEEHPAPHPNGKNFTFTRKQRGEVAYYMGHINKPISRKLTVVDTPSTGNLTPGVINPDGTKMVYASGSYIWIYNLESNSKVQVVEGFDPSWYSGGDKIVFVRDAIEGRGLDTSIWTMNEDGTNMTEVVDSRKEIAPTEPKVSPDGSKICYEAVSVDGSNVWMVNSDGTEKVQITTHPLSDLNPNWIGSNSIVFTSYRPKSGKYQDRNWNIWIGDIAQ